MTPHQRTRRPGQLWYVMTSTRNMVKCSLFVFTVTLHCTSNNHCGTCRGTPRVEGDSCCVQHECTNEISTPFHLGSSLFSLTKRVDKIRSSQVADRWHAPGSHGSRPPGRSMIRPPRVRLSPDWVCRYNPLDVCANLILSVILFSRHSSLRWRTI